MYTSEFRNDTVTLEVLIVLSRKGTTQGCCREGRTIRATVVGEGRTIRATLAGEGRTIRATLVKSC